MTSQSSDVHDLSLLSPKGFHEISNTLI